MIWNRLSGSFGETDLAVATRIFNYIWKIEPSGDVPEEKIRRKVVDTEKELEKCLAGKFKFLNLAAHPPLIEKAKKLYKSIAKNRMTILYGPTLSAKSTILKVKVELMWAGYRFGDFSIW